MAEDKESKTVPLPDMFVNDTAKNAAVVTEEPAKEPEKAEEKAKAEPEPVEEELDPKSPLAKMLQKEQMKRANFEKSQVASLQTLKEELLAAINARGGTPTAKQEQALEKIEAIEDGRDPMEGATLADLKKLDADFDKRVEKKAREIADRALRERDETSAANLAAEKQFLEDFDKEAPEHLKGKAAEVLDAYRQRISRFKGLDRLNKEDRTTLEQEQYQLALGMVEATAKTKSPISVPPAKKPGKSPEGTQVVKTGASTVPVQTAAAPRDQFGLPPMFKNE